MTNFKVLYDRLRVGKLVGGVDGLTTTEFQGIDAILKKAAERGLRVADVAYILATAYHETGGEMQAIRERGGAGYFTRMYDVTGTRSRLARDNGNIKPGDGARYFGRGLVQITWHNNYLRVGKLIGVNLVGNPDEALKLPIAVTIAVDGMIDGWFTGKSLKNYLPRSGRGSKVQFMSARRIINGTDKAELIAGYAQEFQEDLIAAGWTV